MARIRSIHPGIFTDEAFASCSAPAQVLLFGLWTEADDNGVFEWKPVSLKMRVLPVAAVDSTALLDELAGFDIIKRVEIDGKAYGLIRNFCKYQRPRKPKAWHPMPEAHRAYVGLPKSAPAGGEPEGVPQKSALDAVEASAVPTSAEKSAQMKEGGGRMETSEENSTPSSADGAGADFEDIERKCRKAAGLVESPAPGLLDLSPIFFWLDSGYQLERHILPVLRAKAAKTKTEVHSWRFFDGALRDALQRDKPAAAEPAKPIRYRVEQSGERWYVEVGSPEYRAWREHTGKGGSVRHRNGFQMVEVESRWPPGHAPAEPLRAVSG